MEAVGLVRVSTDEQAASGLSLADQRQRIEAYCTAMGHDLIAVYEEAGVSTRTPVEKRPQLVAAIRTLQPGRVLVVCKLDRLCRSILHIYEIQAAIDARGGELAAIQEHVDTSTAMGKAYRNLIMVFAELERDKISERTKAALAAKARLGEKCGRTPYGKSNTGRGRQVPDAVQQLVIARMAAERNAGASYAEIARRLNADDIASPTGGDWAETTVRRVTLASMPRQTA
jgi:DNA invertase Pin-like site-specific DNA recombinase